MDKQKNEKLNKYLANSNKRQERRINDSLEMEIERDTSEAASADFSKKPQNKASRATVFILPHHVSSLWPKIEKNLKNLAEGKCKNILNFIQIVVELISLHYKAEDVGDIDVTLLLRFLERLSKEEAENFFKNIVPFLGKLALETKALFPDSVKILSQGSRESLFLTKRQVACLFVNMFLCTIHKQLDNNLLESRKFNFLNIYRAGSHHNEIKVQKLNCFYNYLKRMQKGSECTVGVNISYERIGLKPANYSIIEKEFWEDSKRSLKKVLVYHKGNLDTRKGAIKVDFANQNLGGGTLNEGIVQEEILFCTHPELVPAMLFTEALEDDESLLVIGAERFSNHSGYGTTFKFDTNAQEQLDLDIYQRKSNIILSMDAQNYSQLHKNSQYMNACLLREINKAYIGFSSSEVLVENEVGILPVATGKWGCGVFGGDPQFKFFIQWIACSQAGREMMFYTYEDQSLEKLDEIIKVFKSKTVGEAFKLLLDYGNALLKENMELDLFDYINDF